MPIDRQMDKDVSQVALMVKNLPGNAGGTRHPVSISGLGRSSGEGNSYPLQYPGLENPMDRGAWQASLWGNKESYATE